MISTPSCLQNDVLTLNSKSIQIPPKIGCLNSSISQVQSTPIPQETSDERTVSQDVSKYSWEESPKNTNEGVEENMSYNEKENAEPQRSEGKKKLKNF